ncbi:hypothetical protein LB579_33205 [Mesorhizobium sp. BR1-1-7]|uniref:hypothetical protein n=1 Tax=Mesorhizobium sp. BR1-1-7 TaxID=2876647 RepID=UPI001CC9E431|nr:hypothetical protein [Mesorhizobium sp. BR1-1-7]MBZ9922520.1 hypothetical protein [Mesorhizobium sp. BR1-1-7]
MAGEKANGPGWVVAIGSALIALVGSYFTANYAATSAVAVAKQQADAAIASAKTQADAAVQTAKQTAQASIDAAKAANRVEMAKLALTYVNDKTTPEGIRAWAVRLLADCTGVPLTQEETDGIVRKIGQLEPEDPNGKLPWQSLGDPKLGAIVKALKQDYSAAWYPTQGNI